jgi:putative CocE/NonD family hydrolase
MGWIREQTDGPYWRRGSLAPQYEALECAVFQVAGWSDAYVDAAFRIQERCTNAAVRTLVGNWVHSFPDDAYPGPNLDWLHELVRFFDRYLNDVDNGWEHEPAVTWFEREYATPEPFPAAWPGRWRAAATFPVPGTERRTLHLAGAAAGTLAAEHRAGAHESVATIPHRATTGTSGPLSWGAGWHPNGLARDLRPDEARGATWTSEPLADAMSVIGVPVAVLHLTASMPVATCVVRLSEVAPDGTSSLVATGVLNLTHRLSDTDPSPMPTRGLATEVVRIPLRTTGYRFPVGARLRLSVLTSLWPVLWPSPIPGELRVHAGPATPSRLELPVLPDTAPTLEPPAFRTEPVVMREVGSSEEDAPEWRIEEDVIRGTRIVTIFDGAASTQEDGSRLYASERLVLTASDADPAHATLASDVVYRYTGEGWDADIRATGLIASDEGSFDVRVALDVSLDGKPFFAREWRESIPRNLV